jgi:predicted AAA+ superfamily ATPase
VIIDDVQKIPPILDEVHRLMEQRKLRFALSGSSARKLKRGGANLLGGRALSLNMEGFSAKELGDRSDAKKMCRIGTLPLVHNTPQDAEGLLSSYVQTYLKEEVQAEGLVRKIEPFVRFLEVAGLMNSQVVNGEALARDAHVARSTVDTYFSILTDTLLAHWLPAYRPRSKVREGAKPKLYWFDPAVAAAAAGTLGEEDELSRGASLETLVFHELRVYNAIRGRARPLYFYGGDRDSAEVDFLIETRKKTLQHKPSAVLIEVKSALRWRSEFESASRSLASSEKIHIQSMYGVYMGTESFEQNGFQVLAYGDFIRKLFAGEIY